MAGTQTQAPLLTVPALYPPVLEGVTGVVWVVPGRDRAQTEKVEPGELNRRVPGKGAGGPRPPSPTY